MAIIVNDGDQQRFYVFSLRTLTMLLIVFQFRVIADAPNKLSIWPR